MANQRVTLESGNVVVVYSMGFHYCAPFANPLHYELSASARWKPGFGAHKFTSNVTHQGQRIALEGHDLGWMLIHVPVVVFNALLPLVMMNSSRKMMFAASTVKMNGAPTGCSNHSSTPMMACSIAIPMAAFPVNNDANTVLVGMTSADMAAGEFAWKVAAATELLLFGLSIAGGPGSILGLVAGELGVPTDPSAFIKPAAAILAGGFKMAVTGEGSIELGIGGPLAGAKVTVSRKRDAQGEGSWDLETEAGTFFYTEKQNVKDVNKKTSKTSNPITGDTTTTEKSRRVNPDGTITETVVEERANRRGEKTGGSTTVNTYDEFGRPTGPAETTQHEVPPRHHQEDDYEWIPGLF
jgi:hypothetical protein